MDAVEKLLEKVEKRGEKKPLATGETPDVKDVKLPKQSKESKESIESNESNKSNKLHKPNESIEIHETKSSNQSNASRKSMKFFDSIEPSDSKEAEKTSQSMHSLQSLQSLLSFKQERSYLFPDVADYRFVDYASVYFQRKKTFFRNASVEPLCCFSAKPLLHPLHPVNRMHLADILGFEHSILTIQGVLPDAKSHRHSAVYGLLSNADLQKLDSIIRGLIRFPDLTDEIFAFFIRQTNECTDARAESKAFEALFVLSQFCRPSDQLLPYLVAHLYKRCHSDDEVGLSFILSSQNAGIALYTIEGLLERAVPLQDLEESEWEKRRSQVVARLSEVENTRIPSDLRGCSVGELLTVEKMTELFARHGFPIETDAVVRLLPGALGDEMSSVDESFATGASGGLLEYAQYTRPADFEGRGVPDVLLSGDHAKVDAWRRENAIERTCRWRPDLIASAGLTDAERERASALIERYHGLGHPDDIQPR